jgi:hypothetical protein
VFYRLFRHESSRFSQSGQRCGFGNGCKTTAIRGAESIVPGFDAAFELVSHRTVLAIAKQP